tara:strand:+ start:1446 stop:1655 length:210 start_codon:yes stop_codon:yes gene_type:complete
MGKNNRKYYVSCNGTMQSLRKKAFLVYWNDDNQKISTSAGPYNDYKDAEKIMIKHLINGVCSWIVSYNG